MEISPYLPHPFLIGYCNGTAAYLKPTAKSIASFIAVEGLNGDIVITTPLDTMLLKTFGQFIDKCPDQEFLTKELLPILVPMQKQEAEPETAEEYTVDLSELEEADEFEDLGEDDELEL